MTFQIKRSLLAASVAAAIVAPVTGFATNGMNLEGYGPIATGMGGASMAYDNGVAAVMNNPATLGLMEDGEGRFDFAIGSLDPDITSSMTGMPDAPSTAGPFYMPAVGYATRNGDLTYGIGMAAQGGMGTEYDATSFLAAGTNEEVRSEVGFGRLVAPIVYNVDKNLTIGGSLDYVWAGMDLKMALSGAQFFDFMPGSTNNAGVASGDFVNTFGGVFTANNTVAPTVNPDQSVSGTFDLYNTRFDFSNDSDFTGEATGNGFAGKLGFTYKVNKNLTLGGTYHTKTNIGDLEASNISLSMGGDFSGVGGPVGPSSVSVSGKISVNDFQWPSTFGFGASYAQDKWMVAADVKVIQWSDVMDSFRMTFTADATQADPLATGFGVAGQSFDIELFQNWDDQTVIQIGGAYKVTADTTLRAGINSASNPVPNSTVNPLFPATIENHYTLGVGYAVSKMSSIDFSLTIAPEVSVDGDSGVTTDHSQMNWQFMYSQKF